MIKLHGDALLDPKNLEDETARLDEQVQKVLADHLSKRGIIFVGYGGNDESITSFLKELPKEALTWGVYWINDHIPENEFGRWLRSRIGVVHVNHVKFDELMVLVRSEFGLGHPSKQRFEALMRTYGETFSELDQGVANRPEGEAKEALSSALGKATAEFDNWWTVELEARRHKQSNPGKVDKIYQAGLNKFERSPELLGSYANFLADERKDMDKAKEYYQRAIKVDPNHPVTLGNYAVFLKNERKDMNKAEVYYQRAIKVDPNNANNLGNYANFLVDERKDMDKAEEYYQRAIKVNPNHANNLDNYAGFLRLERKHMDKAEEYYQRSIKVNPNHANNLGNYAGFLLARGESARGLRLLEKTMESARRPDDDIVVLECQFYRYAHARAKEHRETLRAIRALLVAGIRSPGWNFSDNIERARSDGHRGVSLLKALDQVISKGGDLSELDAFDEWRRSA